MLGRSVNKLAPDDIVAMPDSLASDRPMRYHAPPAEGWSQTRGCQVLAKNH
jgi:hypothetical protein